MSATSSNAIETHPGKGGLLRERPDPFLGVETPPGAQRVRLLGVYYVHCRTPDGGDLYVTKHGLPLYEHLKLKNWRDEEWFTTHRERLQGTSTVYKVPSKRVNNRAVNLVVKWCRVGEEVPMDTMAFSEFCDAEFNTPFEEFSLAIEMRERRTGPRIRTNRPLAIYVPPQRLKLWQTGRSRSTIARKVAKFRDVELDILRQYILLYEWVDGLSAHEAVDETFGDIETRQDLIARLAEQARADMEESGYFVVDHKPAHVIVRPRPDGTLLKDRTGRPAYALIDFELLSRTPEFEHQVEQAKREAYLQNQRIRFDPPARGPLPDNLKRVTILDTEYVWGHAESTQGQLWVVGRNPQLFDYFLPERWRHTRRVKLSHTAETYHTISKDHVKLVWKISRVGETPEVDEATVSAEDTIAHGYNSPFEEFSIAMELFKSGFSVVYPRAIYRVGLESPRAREYVTDLSRFRSHQALVNPEGQPILSPEYNYISVWGFWQGRISAPDAEDLPLCTGVDLVQALHEGVLSRTELEAVLERKTARLEAAGFEANLKPTHFLLSRYPDGSLERKDDGTPTVTLSNFELIRRRPSSSDRG